MKTIQLYRGYLPEHLKPLIFEVDPTKSEQSISDNVIKYIKDSDESNLTIVSNNEIVDLTLRLLEKQSDGDLEVLVFHFEKDSDRPISYSVYNGDLVSRFEDLVYEPYSTKLLLSLVGLKSNNQSELFKLNSDNEITINLFVGENPKNGKVFPSSELLFEEELVKELIEYINNSEEEVVNIYSNSYLVSLILLGFASNNENVKLKAIFNGETIGVELQELIASSLKHIRWSKYPKGFLDTSDNLLDGIVLTKNKK